jgi:eukaryotic-like serine/threonine-protein kinase
MPLSIGTLLNNRYEIRAILGQGGMGAVYRAEDKHLNIPVAVKENLFLTKEYGEQFKREACILAGLRHSNLPHVIDYFGLENQGQYLVMDFIEGEDLRQRMERMGPLPDREVILIGISICDALMYMHTRTKPLGPVVHRDIKPGNIKVTPERQAVLVDFGLAKVMQGSQVTSTGARAMTPGYSPPEQYGHARTDPRSDIYSLGATLYAALTGIIPEDGLARMTEKADLTPIRELSPKAGRKLAEAIEKALEVDSDDRFQNAEEFRKALIEAGELVPYYQERPTLAPPPVAAGPEGTAGHERGPQDSKVPWVSEHKSRKRRQKRSPGWVTIPAMAVLAVAAFIINNARPDLAKSFLDQFLGTPTVTAQPTQISAISTSPNAPGETPSVSSNSTGSPMQPVSGDATSTPTLEPTLGNTSTPTETPLPTPTQRGGGWGQVAFASNRTGVMQIWLVNADGKSAPRQITNEPSGACQPSWAPDGMRLAYTSPCGGRQDSYAGSTIYIIDVDADGKELSKTQIPQSMEGDYDPAFAPDGKRLAFTSLRNGQSAVFVLNLVDNSISEISQLTYADKQPAWAPSGMQLAFVRKFNLSTQIIVSTDQGQSQKVFTTLGPNSNSWPAWSADGQVIFYSQTAPDSPPVLMYKRWEDRESAVETRIPAKPTGNDGPYAQVSASLDGAWLAYESWPDSSNHDIYIMNINGANQQRLTKDPGIDFWPAWRPLLAPKQP